MNCELRDESESPEASASTRNAHRVGFEEYPMEYNSDPDQVWRAHPSFWVGIATKKLYGDTIASVLNMRYPRDYRVSLYHLHPAHLRDPKEIVLWKYRKMREEFLQSTREALVFIEDDMVVPEKTLLWFAQGLVRGYKVIYGVYCFRHHHLGYAPNVALPVGKTFRDFEGQVVTGLYAVGFGCLCIAREVLELIDFRLDSSREVYPDVCFQEDVEPVFREKIAVDFRVNCGHFARQGEPVEWLLKLSPDGVVTYLPITTETMRPVSVDEFPRKEC